MAHSATMEARMKKISVLILILLGLLLNACSSNNEETDEDAIKVYYIDTRTSGLVDLQYDIISTETLEQVGELIYTLRLNPENPVYTSVLPDTVSEPAFVINEDMGLTLNFDSTYSNLTGIDEILCRAALVKTLSQVAGIEYIQINVNGNPLIDSNDEVVGPLTAEDFIDSTDAAIYNKMKLYFTNEEGTALVEYNTEINDDAGNSSMEELVINQLINGPTKLELYPTIPDGTVLLNVSTSDGICTVDFNEKFLDKLPNVSEEVTIYSVVNSLVELPDINKVKFTINNQVVETFWEETEFDVPFERNLEMIEATK